MNTYSYRYRSDSKQEIIGRVKATGLYEAREQISIIKNLPTEDIDRLFVIIKEETGHENQVRTYSNK